MVFQKLVTNLIGRCPDMTPPTYYQTATIKLALSFSRRTYYFLSKKNSLITKGGLITETAF